MHTLTYLCATLIFNTKITMNSISSFNRLIENTIVDNWDMDALTDYKGVTYQYKDVARKIEKLHILFEESGIENGDKIAICGRNCTHCDSDFALYGYCP